MLYVQIIVFLLATVIILSIWLVIALVEKKQRQSQARDLNFTDGAEQDTPFSP